MPDRRLRRRLASACLALTAAVGCQSPTPPPSAGTPFELTLPEADEKALTLLLADREIYEGFAVSKALEGSASLRRHLATMLGRSGQPQGRVVLERLTTDADVEVRRAAVFALGVLGEVLAERTLLATASSPDRETGRLSVEALAKLGVGLAEVRTALARLEPREQWERLLPSLYRFDKEASLPAARQGLELTSTDLRRWAVYALARRGIPSAAPDLRPLLADDDPWVRGWAARTLGDVGESADMVAVAALLADPEEGPVIQAVRAGTRLVARGVVAPPERWRRELVRLADDPRAGVRMTALEAAGHWLLDEELGALLAERARSGSSRERQLALLALARGGDPRAGDLAQLAAASEDLQLRRRAADAARILDETAILESLAGDPHPAVRVSVLEARLAADSSPIAGGPGAAWAAAALEDLSAAVRSTALRWVAEHPVVPLGSLRRALAASTGGDRVDLETAMIRAVESLLDAGVAAVEEAAEIFDTMARSPDYLVRREAVRALGELGVAAPPVGPAEDLRTLLSYRETLQRTASDRFAVIETRHGTIRLRLACPQAPMTCLSFLQLAEQGFFDGLPFHRVVPDFVVQAGDPSGGGWGGPGYSLRDEINRLRFETGVVGMAHAGPDTAGSQFFITLSAQPHLDGTYTAFGRVESGLEVLLRIEQEDRIVRLREVGG